MTTKKTATKTPETILEAVTKGGQGASYQKTFRAGGRVLKATVKVDTSYAFQGHGHLYVWAPASDSWNLIVSIPGENLLRRSFCSPASGGPRAADFAADVDVMTEAALQVLAG